MKSLEDRSVVVVETSEVTGLDGARSADPTGSDETPAVLSGPVRAETIDPAVQPSPDETSPRLEGIVIGWIAGRGADHRMLVDFPGNGLGKPLAAVSIAHAGAISIGTRVALAFDGGDPGCPMVLGVVVTPGSGNADEKTGDDERARVHVSLDGETLTFAADKRIVLKCGKASVTLTEDGKIQIEGTYVLSRSKGVNRIMGGSVQLN